MTIFPSVRLDKVADLNPRLTPRPIDTTTVSFVAMADVRADGTTTSGIDRPFGEVAKGYTQFRRGDVLVAKITPCFENGKIAMAKTRHSQAAGSTEFHVVRPRPGISDGRYLHHFLRQPFIRIAGERRMTGSGGQRRIPESYLAQLKIPLPPIGDQRRIADVLDRANELRNMRRDAVALLGDLAQSIFLDMFGSPPVDQALTTVGKLAAEERSAIRTGPFGSQLLHSEFVPAGIPVLGIDNVVENEFRWSGRRFITEEKYQQLARYRVLPGDVLITIMGTCGRCAIVPDDISTAINTKHLCCITLNQDICLPEFLHDYFLMHPIARSYLQRTAKGAIMSGLNMGIIKELPVALPPMAEQREYVGILRALQKQKEQNVQQVGEIVELCNSLRQRAFRGEL